MSQSWRPNNYPNNYPTNYPNSHPNPLPNPLPPTLREFGPSSISSVSVNLSGPTYEPPRYPTVPETRQTYTYVAPLPTPGICDYLTGKQNDPIFRRN